jgi:hypothetical protein
MDPRNRNTEPIGPMLGWKSRWALSNTEIPMHNQYVVQLFCWHQDLYLLAFFWLIIGDDIEDEVFYIS